MKNFFYFYYNSGTCGRTLTFPVLVLGLLFFFSGSLSAQTPIPGNYAPGASAGMLAAVMAPPGTVILENGTLFYNTRKFVDSDGNKINTPTTNGLGNRTVIGYVPKFEIFGANYNPAIIITFRNQLLRPEPNSEKDFQIGDWIIQPVSLGWHWDEWHAIVSYSIWLPTGRFNAGANNNTGKGLFSHMLTAGTTWLQDAPNPWIINVQARYELFGKQETTNIRPGDVMTIEYAGGKQIAKVFDIGVFGFFSFQTTKQENSPPGTDTSRYRYYGIGPEVAWRPSFLPGAKAAVRVSIEFGSRNTSEGVGSILSLSYAF